MIKIRCKCQTCLTQIRKDTIEMAKIALKWCLHGFDNNSIIN